MKFDLYLSGLPIRRPQHPQMRILPTWPHWTGFISDGPRIDTVVNPVINNGRLLKLEEYDTVRMDMDIFGEVMDQRGRGKPNRIFICGVQGCEPRKLMTVTANVKNKPPRALFARSFLVV